MIKRLRVEGSEKWGVKLSDLEERVYYHGLAVMQIACGLLYSMSCRCLIVSLLFALCLLLFVLLITCFILLIIRFMFVLLFWLWLRCCATIRKVAGSIPAGVSGFFIDIKSF